MHTVTITRATRSAIWLASLFLLNANLSLTAATSHAKATVPFHTTSQGFVILDAYSDNGEHLSLLLDSGQGLGLLLDRQASLRTGMKKVALPPITFEGYSADAQSSDDWRHGRLRSNGLVLVDGNFPTVDLSPFERAMGLKIDGVIGEPLLSKYVVRIDRDAQELQFFESKKFVYSGGGFSLPLLDSGGTGLLIVDGKMELRPCVMVPIRFWLDTGANADVTLNHKLTVKYPEFGVRDLDTRSAGIGAMRGKWGLSSEIQIGETFVKTENNLALSGDSMSSLNQVADAAIGAPVLSNYNVIVDRPRGRVIFEMRSMLPLASTESCQKEVQ